MMKRQYAFIGMIVALVGSAAVYADQKLTVATFNCEFLTRPKVHMKFGERFDLSAERMGTWDQPGYRDEKFAEAAKAVAQFIKEINADVIGLEEVGDERDVHQLWEAVREAGLDYPYCVVGSPVEDDTYQNNAVFSKFELRDLIAPLPGREAYDTELDDPEAEEWTGVRKGLRVTFDAYGQTIYLYVLHLTSERGGHEADARRIAEASIVRRHYLPVLTGGEHVIVMGDLNDRPKRAGDPADSRARRHSARFDPDRPVLLLRPRRAGHALDVQFQRRRTNQIDHVLLSESIEQACRRVHSRTVNHGKPFVSDHLPFIVELYFKK